MKKTTAFFAMFALLVTIGCGSKSGQYGELKDAMSKTIKINEEFTSSIEKAKSGKDVANALNKFSDSMEKMIPTIKKLDKKFKEIEMKDPNKTPAELKDLVQKNNDVAKRMGKAFMGMAKYAKDPDVLKAQMKFQAVMKKMM